MIQRHLKADRKGCCVQNSITVVMRGRGREAGDECDPLWSGGGPVGLRGPLRTCRGKAEGGSKATAHEDLSGSSARLGSTSSRTWAIAHPAPGPAVQLMLPPSWGHTSLNRVSTQVCHVHSHNLREFSFSKHLPES